jgi:hypothetical protein
LPSTSTSPTENQLKPLGPEDLPMPDEARTQDAAGAEAFVRYYIELINRTSKTLDSEPLIALSEGCQDCERIARNATDSAAAGYRYEGGEITLTEITAPLITDDRAEMAVRLDQAALVVRDSRGEEVADGSSDSLMGLPGSVALMWAPDIESWVMTYMAFG